LYSQYHYSGSFGSLAGGFFTSIFLPLFKGIFRLKFFGIILIFFVTLISHNLWLKLSHFRTRYPYIQKLRCWQLRLMFHHHQFNIVFSLILINISLKLKIIVINFKLTSSRFFFFSMYNNVISKLILMRIFFQHYYIFY